MMTGTLWRVLPTFLRRRLERRLHFRQIAANAGWLISEHVVRLALGVTVTVWVARYLGPQEYGVLSYAIALVAIFEPIATLGLNTILVRDIVNTPSAGPEILGTAFAFRAMAGMLAFVIVNVVVLLLRPDDGEVRFLVLLVGFSLVLRSFEVIGYLFQSRLESKFSSIAVISALLVCSTVNIALIYRMAPLYAFGWTKLGEFALASIGLMIAYRSRGYLFRTWRVSLSRAASLLRRSWPLILSGLGAVIYLRIDQVMLGHLSGEVEVGTYAVAARLSEMWYFIPNAIAASVFPKLLEEREVSPELYDRHLQDLYDLLAVGALAITVLTSLLAYPAITILYGDAYKSAIHVLLVHIWGGIFVFLRAALNKWFIAEGLFFFALITHGTGALVNIVLNAFLIPLYGGVGAAVATVASHAIASYLVLFCHPKTRKAGRMMTIAIVAPLHLLRVIRTTRK